MANGPSVAVPSFDVADRDTELLPNTEKLLRSGGDVLTAFLTRTSIYEGSGFTNELISFGSGDYLNDTVGIGGVTTPNIFFGYLDNIGFPEQIPYTASSIAGKSTPQRGCDHRLRSFRLWLDLPRERTSLPRGCWAVPASPAEERFYNQQGRVERLPRVQ